MEDPLANAEPDGPLRPRPPWILRAVLLVVIAAVAAFFLLRPSEESGAATLPDVTLQHLSGDGSLSTADMRGTPMVINFWASWCDPCRRESPLLDEMYAEYKDRGLLIVGVDVQDVPIAAREFVEEFGLGYPMVEDPEQELFGELTETQGLPQTYFVDVDGNVVQSGPAAPVLGEIEEEQLRAAIEALLEDA